MRTRYILAALSLLSQITSATAQGRDYPWCLSREGYLSCFYATQQQCQWAASGIGGCAQNPRLLFPSKPYDSGARHS
jgi:Protein of unknown function (DUF3551)